MNHEFQTTLVTEVLRVDGGRQSVVSDHLAVEEPLNIAANGRSLGVTMRTPGMDRELIIGFLVSEGVLREPSDLLDVTCCSNPQTGAVTAEAILTHEASDRVQMSHARTISSACGVCGREQIADLLAQVKRFTSVQAPSASTLELIQQRVADRQAAFHRTGGLHAAALLDEGGQIEAFAEDIGRHNAVDKVVGAYWQAERKSPCQLTLYVSGRAGFDIVQKAAVSGIPRVISVSAPSSLAVQLARELGMGLIGFARGHRYNIYSGYSTEGEGEA